MYRRSIDGDRASNLRDDSEKTQLEVNSANKPGLQGTEDVFVDKESHQIQYKTLNWQVSEQQYTQSSALPESLMTEPFLLFSGLSMCPSSVRQSAHDCGDSKQWNALASQCRSGRR